MIFFVRGLACKPNNNAVNGIQFLYGQGHAVLGNYTPSNYQSKVTAYIG